MSSVMIDLISSNVAEGVPFAGDLDCWCPKREGSMFSAASRKKSGRRSCPEMKIPFINYLSNY